MLERVLRLISVPLRFTYVIKYRHESRVLQLLQGHPAIPAVYGYGHLPHFEYTALELLGPNIKQRRPFANSRVPLKTVVCIVQQILSGLQHMHEHGFVHCDIKPENLLCSINDENRIMFIDFGLTRRIEFGPPNRYATVGTLYWASLNAHDRLDIAPRDDLESLFYVALFLLRGRLPWISQENRSEPPTIRLLRIHQSKRSISSATPSAEIPTEFGTMLDYCRGLAFNQMPDYQILTNLFDGLAQRIGCVPGEPLDWTSSGVYEEFERDLQVDCGAIEEGDNMDSEGCDSEEQFSNSYFDWGDFANWDIQGARDGNLTLLTVQEETADSNIPEIVHVDQYLPS